MAISTMLNKLIVARFYKINAAFFLLLLLVSFGVLNAHDTLQFHYVLMQAITGSYRYFGIAWLVWLLYNIKCISYGLKVIALPKNSFLYNLQSLPVWRQWLILLATHCALYMPGLAYGGAAAAIGFAQGRTMLSMLVVLLQLLMCSTGAAIWLNRLNSTWKTGWMDYMPSFTLPWSKRRRFTFYLVHYSLGDKKRTLLAIKVCSLLLLQLMLGLDRAGLNKENICVLMAIVISAHALLPLYYVTFMEQQLAFLRNMPIPLVRRFAVYLLTYSLLFVPELLFMLLNGRNVLGLQVIFSLFVLAIGSLSMLTSVQYAIPIKMEQYTFILFALFFITLLLLTSVPIWLLAGIELALACGMFCYGFYRYSYKAG